MSWIHKVKSDINALPDSMDHFNSLYLEMKRELSFSVGSLEQNATRLPAIMEHVFSSLQEIESILEYLNIKLKSVRSATFRKYLENYQRALSSRDADKYVDGEPDVVEWAEIVNEFALVRNKFLSLTKGLEQKGWMISHVTKLRCAGLEDIHIN